MVWFVTYKYILILIPKEGVYFVIIYVQVTFPGVRSKEIYVGLIDDQDIFASELKGVCGPLLVMG